MMSDFSKKAKVLSELWLNYKEDKNFKDFIEYNDLGLPLAHFIYSGLVTPGDQAKYYVEETYDLLLAALGLSDSVYESLDEMLGSVPQE